jgi:hypothetical protein
VSMKYNFYSASLMAPRYLTYITLVWKGLTLGNFMQLPNREKSFVNEKDKMVQNSTDTKSLSSKNI